MWYNEAVFYQIYPFGFCGEKNIEKVIEWLPHIKAMGASAICFCPVFESVKHGYDTKDYNNIDSRLGNNEDFALMCKKAHENGIKIVLDGVFNHVGREFWAFKDVQKNKQKSKYKDWFHINFDGNSNDNDGFWYEGWEGHYSLVKLNLHNAEVQEHIFESIKNWVDTYDIDGLRLDVAYLLPEHFIKALNSECKKIKDDFFLVGELIHGDYKVFVGDGKLDSCTNYECYKGIYSSFNDKNMFEIAHSLNRQFGKENWTLYRDMHLLSFVDNHDVSRIASILKEEKHLAPLYTLLFGMPGIPCVYYGSEWGIKGDKKDGDDALRPCITEPVKNELFKRVSNYADIHKKSKALCYGSYSEIYLTNGQYIFMREYEDEKVLVVINAADESHEANFDINCKKLLNLETNEELMFNGKLKLKPFCGEFYSVV